MGQLAARRDRSGARTIVRRALATGSKKIRVMIRVMKWPRRLVGSHAAGKQAVQETGLLHVAAGLGAALVAAGAGAALAGGVGPHHSALARAVMAHARRAPRHRALVRVVHAGLLHVVRLRGGAGLGLGKGRAAHEAEGGGRNDELLHLKLLVG